MGLISTPVKWPIAKRLQELSNDLSDVIERYGPVAMSLEKVYIKGNRSAASAVERATGVMMLTAAEAGISVWEYSPNTIKKIVTGDGSATKDAVKLTLRKTLNLAEEGLPHDAFDAVAVAICHLQHLHLELVP
jgi:crossover junction endodeoxyribonuclease RuvC